MKKLLLIIIILLSGILGLKAQQSAQVSQYMFNGIYINPAYAGYRGLLNLHAFYRAQWIGVNGGPRTMSFAADASANDGNVGLAIMVNNDHIAALNNLSAYANYAYRLKLGEETRLAFGLGAGISQIRINGSELKPIEGDDHIIPASHQSVMTPDIRTGIFLSDTRYYVGFSADNILPQFMNFAKDPSYLMPAPKPHFYFTGGGMIYLSDNYEIKPSFLIKDIKGGPTTMDINAFLLLYDKVWLGGSYRTSLPLYKKSNLQSSLEKQNALSVITELYLGDRFRVGYSYDFSLSRISQTPGQAPTHEISLGYYFTSKNSKMLSPRHF